MSEVAVGGGVGCRDTLNRVNSLEGGGRKLRDTLNIQLKKSNTRDQTGSSPPMLSLSISIHLSLSRSHLILHPLSSSSSFMPSCLLHLLSSLSPFPFIRLINFEIDLWGCVERERKINRECEIWAMRDEDRGKEKETKVWTFYDTGWKRLKRRSQIFEMTVKSQEL